MTSTLLIIFLAPCYRTGNYRALSLIELGFVNTGFETQQNLRQPGPAAIWQNIVVLFIFAYNFENALSKGK